jgi:hypothetical protein
VISVSRASSRWAPVLRVLWVLGLVAAFGLMVAVVVEAASSLDLRSLNVGWLVVSTALFALAWAGFARAWVALNGAGDRHPVHEAAAWVHSQLLRYLPGAVWAPIKRASGVQGETHNRIATVVVEAMIFLASAACVGGLVGGLSIDPRLMIGVAAPFVALVVVRLGANRFGLRTDAVVRATLWLLPCWALYGLASAAAQAAVGRGPSVAAVVSASLVAWAAGFVIVVAPGGTGVREVVYGALLAGTAASSRLAAGALAARLTFTVGELVVLAGLGWLARRQDRRVSSTAEVARHSRSRSTTESC